MRWSTTSFVCTRLATEYYHKQFLNSCNHARLMLHAYVFVRQLDLCLWPIAQFINFKFMPASLRVLYVCGITLIWNMILAYIKHEVPVHVELKRFNAVCKITQYF